MLTLSPFLVTMLTAIGAMLGYVTCFLFCFKKNEELNKIIKFQHDFIAERLGETFIEKLRNEI